MAQNLRENERKEKVKKMVTSNTPPIIVDHSPHQYVALTKSLQLTR
jgi:serine kinase of HPr protein (carbohydrate metabolism regulator)